MVKLFETRFPADVFNLKPCLPPEGIFADHYITDEEYRKPFYSWIREFEELEKCNTKFSEYDQLRIKFLNLPSEVREAVSQRMFDFRWKLYGTKKSIFLAGIACFKPKSKLLSSVYSIAVLNAESNEKYQLKEKKFLDNIRGNCKKW